MHRTPSAFQDSVVVHSWNQGNSENSIPALRHHTGPHVSHQVRQGCDFATWKLLRFVVACPMQETALWEALGTSDKLHRSSVAGGLALAGPSLPYFISALRTHSTRVLHSSVRIYRCSPLPRPDVALHGVGSVGCPCGPWLFDNFESLSIPRAEVDKPDGVPRPFHPTSALPRNPPARSGPQEIPFPLLLLGW